MPTAPTTTARTITAEPQAVAARLRDLGLTEAALAAAVRMGQDARASCTPNDPPGSTGIHGWGRTVRGLREHALPLGWTRFDDDNIHGVINLAGTIVIAVSTGDAATGRVESTPKTAYPKGINVQAAVKQNAAHFQMSLFGENVVPIRQEVAPRSTCLMWLLVVHESEDEVLFELSLPDAVGDDERVDAWVERIIMAPISTDPTPRTASAPDAEPDLDIPLTRKT
jgi:hypothetical protein